MLIEAQEYLWDSCGLKNSILSEKEKCFCLVVLQTAHVERDNVSESLWFYRLHMLSEIEEYFRVCHDFPTRSEDSSEPSGRCSMEGLLQQWHARLQMAQVSAACDMILSDYCIALFLHFSMNKCVHVCGRSHLLTCIHVCTHMHAHVHLRTHTRTHARTHAHTHTHTHTHIHTHTHTHTHTHKMHTCTHTLTHTQMHTLAQAHICDHTQTMLKCL